MLENFISHKTVTCNEKDIPRIREQVKAIVKEKKQLVRIILQIILHTAVREK